MKKKEIQAELSDTIYRLIDKLNEIPNNIIKNKSEWIKEGLKSNLTLEECLNMSVKGLVNKAINDITLKDE